MEKYLTLNSVLQMLSGLSDSNKKWLADFSIELFGKRRSFNYSNMLNKRD